MQMKMFLTRLGENARMIVTGDPTQIDLPRGHQIRACVEALRVLDGVDGIATVRFNEDDVVRHPLVAEIVPAYDRDLEGRARAPAEIECSRGADPLSSYSARPADASPRTAISPTRGEIARCIDLFGNSQPSEIGRSGNAGLYLPSWWGR